MLIVLFFLVAPGDSVIHFPSAIISSDTFPLHRQYLPDVPVILVGCKADYREDAAGQKRLADRGISLISREQGEKMAKSIKARLYMECSALTQAGLKELFETGALLLHQLHS